jgi:hypothetical protein
MQRPSRGPLGLSLVLALLQGCAGAGPRAAADAGAEEIEEDTGAPTPGRDGPSRPVDAAIAVDLPAGTDRPPEPPPPDTAPAAVDTPPLGACGDLDGPAIASPLFVPPPAGFVVAPAEVATTVALADRPLAEVQTAVDAARAKDMTTLVRIELKGRFEVSAAPLRLPSRSTLVLDGTLVAAAGATARSLISVENAELVGISGGTVDAGGKIAVGISVAGSAHVHIDGVRIIGAAEDGLRFVGRGATSNDAGSSITRVEVSGAHGQGISIADATNTIVMDCYSHDNGGAGLALGGAFGMAVNNRLRKNATGLVSNGTSNLVYRNAIDCNPVGLGAAATSSDVMIVQNRLGGNGKDLTLGGKENVVYGNVLSAGIEDGGQGNFLLANTGKPPAAKSPNVVFMPPTVATPHQGPVTSGKPRVDLTFTPQTTPDLPAAVAKARTDHPDATLVLEVKGDFTLAGTLTLGSDTVLLLNGTLKLTGTGPVVRANIVSGVAISGGTIDCGGQNTSGIFFETGMATLVDGVKVVNCKADAVHYSHGRPNVMVRSQVQGSNRRCLWAQSLSRLLVIDSEFSGCTMDGIDMDSHDSLTYSLNNHTHDNSRYGVFFEEGGKRNVAVANLTEANGKGVNVYSNASPGTDYNLVVANRVLANKGQGLRAGALPNMDTSSNYFFNNVVSKNGSGIYQDGAVKLNYFSQNVLAENTTAIADMAGNLVFFNPPLK